MVSEIEIQNLKASEFIELYNKNKKSFKTRDYFFDETKDEEQDFEYMEIPQFTEENPLVVENYPYGRLRTQMRYYIETTNRGDRFCSQTLNPKTLKWNKPKKSTYSAVMVMYVNKIGHITYTSLDYNDSEFNLNNAYENFKHLLTKKQKIELAKVLGYTEVMKNVKFEIRKTEYKHKITGEIATEIDIMDLSDWEEVGQEEKDEEQKEINKKINKAISYTSQKKALEIFK